MSIGITDTGSGIIESGAVTFTFTWHTASLNPCPKCRALDGHVWVQTTLSGILSTEEGPVYDLGDDVPLTHIDCKCFLQIDYDIDTSKIPLIQEINATVEEYQT